MTSPSDAPDGVPAIRILCFGAAGISPATLASIVLMTLGRQLYLLPVAGFAATGGGPGTATEILNLYAYRASFTELAFGYGAALAVVLLAITLAVSAVLFRIRRPAG